MGSGESTYSRTLSSRRTTGSGAINQQEPSVAKPRQAASSSQQPATATCHSHSSQQRPLCLVLASYRLSAPYMLGIYTRAPSGGAPLLARGPWRPRPPAGAIEEQRDLSTSAPRGWF